MPERDAFLLGWQVGAKINFTKTVYLQLAPTIYNYTGNGDTFNTHFVGDPTFLDPDGNKVTPNQTGINSLLVFDMPVEFGWKFGEVPMRVFGDFAVNFDGDERAAAAGHPDKGDQRYAYQIGSAPARLKEKHDWQIALGISMSISSRSIPIWLIRTSSTAASTWRASPSRRGYADQRRHLLQSDLRLWPTS